MSDAITKDQDLITYTYVYEKTEMRNRYATKEESTLSSLTVCSFIVSYSKRAIFSYPSSTYQILEIYP